MPKELATELSLLEMRLIHKAPSLDRARRLQAIARTSIPDEIKGRFLRDLGVSTVQANVHVDAVGEPSLSFHGVVRVKMAYRGNMERSSPAARQRINHRLQDVAQKHCMEVAAKELAEQARGWRSV
jgi:hypothetical protein